MNICYDILHSILFYLDIETLLNMLTTNKKLFNINDKFWEEYFKINDIGNQYPHFLVYFDLCEIHHKLQSEKLRKRYANIGIVLSRYALEPVADLSHFGISLGTYSGKMNKNGRNNIYIDNLGREGESGAIRIGGRLYKSFHVPVRNSQDGNILLYNSGEIVSGEISLKFLIDKINKQDDVINELSKEIAILKSQINFLDKVSPN